MVTHTGTFATAIDCMDGRTKSPVVSWIKHHDPSIDYIDTITDAGPVGMLAKGESEVWFKHRAVEISHKIHGSRLLVIVGHHDCAGNPVSEKQQREDIAASVSRASRWGFSGEIIGLWVDENWNVAVVKIEKSPVKRH